MKGLTVTDIKKRLGSTLEDYSPLNTLVKRWVAEFKIGWTNTTGDPHVGRPIEMTTTEKIEKYPHNRFGRP